VDVGGWTSVDQRVHEPTEGLSHMWRGLCCGGISADPKPLDYNTDGIISALENYISLHGQ
jgi:hypothetical protein